ncbi:MAG: hypothetical protein Q4A15_07820 [Prevotellaceae bacterium]|nr:hypothetical protein [Prevotellaceae bacterium]
MTYDKILDDGRLWSVQYEGDNFNALQMLFDQWEDPMWLRDFFLKNIDDLSSYFKITDVNKAIFDTLEDREKLQCLILDISPDADLDKLFRPLDNNRTQEMLLGKEKARLKNTPRHASWLRIYAIKLEPGIYIVTGGAIKLTATMQEREHTLKELEKMEKVRTHLLEQNIVDADAFVDYLTEL